MFYRPSFGEIKIDHFSGKAMTDSHPRQRCEASRECREPYETVESELRHRSIISSDLYARMTAITGETQSVLFLKRDLPFKLRSNLYLRTLENTNQTARK
jgi:hypothetical protein